MFNPEFLIVHCAATYADMDIDAYWINALHLRKGWSGAGYHIFITRSGDIQTAATGFPMRPLNRKGAHVGGCGREWNGKTLGVCLAGGIAKDGTPENNFTDAQMKSLRKVIDDMQDIYDFPDEKIIGHRDLIRMTNSSPKACPCFSVQEFLNKDRMGGEFASPPPATSDPLSIPSTHVVRKGDTLWSISQAYGTSTSQIAKLNGYLQPESIQIGTVIRLLPL